MNCEELRVERAGNDSRSGSTLIEILVVLSIMAVISAMLLTGSKDSAVQVALSTGQATVAGVLNRAKALTLAKYTEETSDPSKLPCGYGVHFDKPKNALVIYQDSQVSLGSCNSQSHDYIATSDPIVETINLDPRIGFVDSPSSPLLDVAFLAPYLRANRTVTITLGINGRTQTTKVEVTVGGSISSL